MVVQYRGSRVELQQFDRSSLPAFDAYVYLAMAEHPSTFTVAPWGYRVLTPFLVRWWPARTDHAYRQLTLAALTAAAVVLFLFLRRLGHGLAGCLAAVAVFGLSGPVTEAARGPFLVEPVSVLLQVSFLLAIEAGADGGTLAILLVLASLSKELLLVLLPPVVFFARRREVGNRGALRDLLAVASPALALSVLVRWVWTPHLHVGGTRLGLESLAVAAGRLPRSAGQILSAALLGGIVPLAAAGALRAGSRRYLRRYGWLLAASAVPPWLAWAAAPGGAKLFFGSSSLRLLIYALPALLPLALAALRSVPRPRVEPGAPAAWRRTAGLTIAWLAALAVPWALDRYRRIDLSGVRDGPRILVLCRESVKAAETLQAGQPVSWAPAELGYLESEAEYHEIKKLRWFLMEGWGRGAQYDYGPVAMQAQSAAFLLPSFADRDLGLTLSLSAPQPTGLRVEVNGVPVGELGVRSEGSAATLRVPRSILFRGDNRVVLHQAAPAIPGPTLDRITIAPLSHR